MDLVESEKGVARERVALRKQGQTLAQLGHVGRAPLKELCLDKHRHSLDNLHPSRKKVRHGQKSL